MKWEFTNIKALNVGNGAANAFFCNDEIGKFSLILAGHDLCRGSLVFSPRRIVSKEVTGVHR